ncbi:ROK family protein [Microbacterium sp. M1A1_1b]|uniref:ROK family transcriptional regulator n=1 Tax=Curtobacterium sp. VKM Ac-2922 TaxID=2929475 RepID=UPI001FB20E55|nr:ROK family transcriptional regulator [Curtobacterium sp. VKM Ac-2922]MCJ1714710.1 ROK family transcriptional regulator [Curtobacterium sp. VKM Ac-2922]
MLDTSDPGHPRAWQPLAGSAQAVVLEVLRAGPRPRTELAARLGLSGPSLSRITRPLLESGVLVERDGIQQTGTGRPSIPLDIDADAHHFIGVKLTGDGLFAVSTDHRGRVLTEREEPLPDRDVSAVVARIAAVVADVTATDSRIRALCVAVGGATEGRSTIRRAPFLGWQDVPLAALLTAATGLPASVENDVRALTHAEHWFGEGRDHRSLALLTVGAGIGLGLVVGDAVVDGAHSTAGSIGHQRLGGAVGASDLQCEFGHRGCARAVLSARALALTGSRALDRTVTAAELLDVARQGDPRARTVVDTAAEALGLLVADVVNVVDPEVVLLSGELVGIAEVGRDALDRSVEAARHWSTPAPTLIAQPFRFNEWARGAAAVAIQMHALGA